MKINLVKYVRTIRIVAVMTEMRIMMRITINNKILIEQPSKAIQEWVRNNLILDNPDFYKKQKMGKWTGNVPSTINLYEKIGGDVRVPFGCIREIWKLVQDAQYSLEFQPIRAVNYVSHINLYPYQEKAVQAVLNAKNGILVMPCGSGKTQCGLEIISRIGGRALWLTHTQDLLNQSRARAESVLETAAGEFGSITAGKVNLGTHITFATVQTMSKLHLEELRNQWDVVIVDECQHCCGSPTRVTQFYKVVSSLCARYKIGLTATPKRSDGLEAAMYALLGGKIHEVSKAEVAHTTCPVKVKKMNTGWIPDYDCILMGDGTIDYSKVIDNMINDQGRYDVVFGDTLIAANHGATMVLANRVAYLQKICEDLRGCGIKSVCLSGMAKSKRAKMERKEALEQLNKGEIDCICATYALAKEGLDVPQLRYVVFATPEQDETTVTQAVGRVGRKADGKEYGIVIDFIDDFGMYRKWESKRNRYYKKIGAEICDTEQ